MKLLSPQLITLNGRCIGRSFPSTTNARGYMDSLNSGLQRENEIAAVFSDVERAQDVAAAVDYISSLPDHQLKELSRWLHQLPWTDAEWLALSDIFEQRSTPLPVLREVLS